LAYDSSKSRATYSRFHGFEENANSEPPKTRPPRCVVDEAWLVQTENTEMLFGDAPVGLDFEGLEISDSELDNDDLEAVKEWERALIAQTESSPGGSAMA
ncbi:hypothetical protein BV25DRAFT_1815752, partial [Artomyces pyxidatus]